MNSNVMKEKNFISAVVYVHNASKNIQSFLSMVNHCLRENFLKYEIICVNDASTDESVQKIKEFVESEAENVVSILNMSFYQGLEASMNAGVDLAIGDFVYEFDTTHASYKEETIRSVYDRCLQGFDIVAACPKNGNSDSGLFYKLYNKYSNSQYKLRTESFRILSRRGINRVHSLATSLPYRKAVYANCGLAMDFVEYDGGKDSFEISKERKNSRKETAQDALILYTDIAYHFSFTFSMAMVGITLLSLIYTIYIYFAKKPVAGWTTTMLLISFGFFGVSAMMTILVKYASVILKTVFKKQNYVIESIEKLK